MPASPTGGVQDTSPPTWFASKSRSPKETAETLFDTSVSARAAAVVCAGRSVTSPQLPLTGTASRRPRADPILPCRGPPADAPRLHVGVALLPGGVHCHGRPGGRRGCPLLGQPPDGHPSDRAAERERPLDALERLPKALVISSSSWPNSGYLLTMSSRGGLSRPRIWQYVPDTARRTLCKAT